MKSIKKIFMVLAVAMLMFSLVLATSYAVATPKNEKKDTGIIIDSKSKTVSYKVTWNANGGKIGTKKTVITSVKKGSKIGNLATTPKRSGYTFKGWYTKKSGGTKISKNTAPKKSISCYAQWKKNSRSLNGEEKKLVGTWSTLFSNVGSVNDYRTGKLLYNAAMGVMYTFNNNGTYSALSLLKTATLNVIIYSEGSWSMSGGSIHLTKKRVSRSYDDGITFSSLVSSPDSSYKIIFGSSEGRQYYTEISSDGTESTKRYKDK